VDQPLAEENAMPRVVPDEPADVVTDAVDLLTRDHRLMEELFTSFFQAAPQQLDPLARRLCKMIRIHTQIEEELFYPAARRAAGSDRLVDESEREHAEAKQSVMRVESMTSDDAEFKQVVEQLRTQIASHVQSEEGQLFPQVRQAKLDLVALGITLAERRDTLMDVLGLHGDDEEGAANMRDIQRPAAQRAGVTPRQTT
jgi:hemerythrin superfamily protein